MLLRSINKHVKDQNWFAVFLDFFIVVVGILIAFQITNWSEAQSVRHDYNMALERYAAEIDANLTDLAGIEENSLERISTVSRGLDALLTCEDSSENRRTVEMGVARIVGAYGVKIRTTSLRELTETPALLAQQSAAERKILNDTRFRIDFLLSESQFFENLPFATAVERNSMLGLGGRELLLQGQYSNKASHTPNLHQLVMAAPLDVACKDDALLKAFFTWEYWQSAIPDVTLALQETLEESREGLKL